jgi:hypothetical protein
MTIQLIGISQFSEQLSMDEQLEIYLIQVAARAGAHRRKHSSTL